MKGRIRTREERKVRISYTRSLRRRRRSNTRKKEEKNI